MPDSLPSRLDAAIRGIGLDRVPEEYKQQTASFTP
jgi:hypothetical protein